ncbi:hypothetical protein Agub_g9587 [Astrephomene gubernaculifera]|uniref:PI3K/PI4K catalytic domain-containing protein n=1 Tax=Astrephomene gubernaculifera TaxID=47775 RepID=A0AAD3HPE5_9CHLO|nr:hypothetical protein Agub_g9587 [Astrephomene gubernaculifera]
MGGHLCGRARIILAFFYSSAAIVLSEAPLPHVNDCFLCMKCHTGKPAGRQLLQAHLDLDGSSPSASLAAATAASDARLGALPTDLANQALGGDPALGEQLAGSNSGEHTRTLTSAHNLREEMYTPPDFKFQIAPGAEELAAKSRKPNCTECYGCDTQIEPLQPVVTQMMGQNVRVEVGASPEWLFFADLPDTPQTGKKAVLKVWCMPLHKVHHTFSWRCGNTAEGAKAVQFLMAQQKVMQECGLLDVTIKVWPGRVNAVVPGHGLHVWWDGLWMERAEGFSLNHLSYKANRQFITSILQNLMGERLNKTHVVRAALYDLLSSQCDRHSQNVFLSESGELTLIDNLQAMQYSWVNCAMDSIFLPGTQKNMILRWGGNVVSKVRGAKMRRSVNPMVVLDYRCYVEGGKIGTNYDPQLRQCLTKLSKMTPKEVQLEYGFPYSSSAAVLQQRATDMLNKGFEWTLRYGQPRNFKPKSLRQHPPCCSLGMSSKNTMECGHPWNNTVELPFGDPMNGGEWRRPYPDPGTYEGGTYLDAPFET